jgi:ABC-type nickel/cobalt efflux system permease component RcnA
VIVLVFALSQGLYAAGVASTFVMAIGTAITVAALASLAVFARDFATRLTGGGRRLAMLLRIIEILAAGAVVLFGLLLLGGALSA